MHYRPVHVQAGICVHKSSLNVHAILAIYQINPISETEPTEHQLILK